MSATRKARAERGFDFYETPAWCVEALHPHLPACERVVDPCIGKGAIVHALQRGRVWWGLEIDPSLSDVAAQVCPVVTRDALAPGRWTFEGDRPELVVMNPPFNRALEFVERALEEVVPGGSVFALLRLAFLEGALRVDFHRRQPADVLVLPRRPSFTGRGTDSSAYAWFAWGPGRGGRWSILDVPPASERRPVAVVEEPSDV